MKLLRELIDLFSGRLSAFVAERPRRPGSGQRRSVSARAAHALKGSIGVFGFEAAHVAAEGLERLARGGDLSKPARPSLPWRRSWSASSRSCVRSIVRRLRSKSH